ncbi:MAG: VOC family protein [Rhodospirillales bacterium]
MLNHVSVGVSRLDRSTAFYDAVLAPLGYHRLDSFDFATAYGTDYPSFWMTLPENGDGATVGNGVHVAFTAPDQAAVDAFHKAALAAGGQCDGKPGLRPYAETYYAAFVRDPDGNKIEAVHLNEPYVPG